MVNESGLTPEQAQNLGRALLNIQRYGGKEGAASIRLPEEEFGVWHVSTADAQGWILEEAEGPSWLDAILLLERLYLERHGYTAPSADAPDGEAAEGREPAAGDVAEGMSG